jgi:acyl-CoA dehydrogenase
LEKFKDKYFEIRQGVRALCDKFPAEYHRKIDAEKEYPEDFVEALTKEGWIHRNLQELVLTSILLL